MSISSTVDSSEAAEYINHQYLHSNRKLPHKPNVLPENVPNIKFEESEGIHVGNVIYNIHHHSSKNDFTESPRTSLSSSKFEDPKKFRKYLNCKSSLILPAIITFIVIGVAVSVSVYFILRKDKNVDTETTTLGTGDTTTNDGTTTERGDTTTSPDDFESLIITREQWEAGEINQLLIPKLSVPIKRIIIAHTRGEICVNVNNCIETVKSLQTQDASLHDIPYNYLIGSDSRIYEGRGMEYEGQHTANLDATEYNSIGICIAFIGNYQSVAPISTQISLLTRFIDFYKNKGMIADDYIIVLQDDLKYFTTKATKLNDEIRKLNKFKSLYRIYRREEWNAQRRKNSPSLFNTRPMNWILIGHTVSSTCSSLDVCKSSGRSLQNTSFNNEWSDILYNIFFGGDGYAFEGRGFDYWGSQHPGLNDKSIAVGVIGTYENVAPNQAIIDAMLNVFDDALALGKLSKDYKIFGRSDFRGPGPGTAFMNIIKTWCRYGNGSSTC